MAPPPFPTPFWETRPRIALRRFLEAEVQAPGPLPCGPTSRLRTTSPSPLPRGPRLRPSPGARPPPDPSTSTLNPGPSCPASQNRSFQHLPPGQSRPPPPALRPPHPASATCPLAAHTVLPARIWGPCQCPQVLSQGSTFLRGPPCPPVASEGASQRTLVASRLLSAGRREVRGTREP